MSETFVIDGKTGKASILKDPNAVLDYTFDWTAWMDAIPETTISLADLSVVGSDPLSNVALQSQTIAGKTVVAWISGGVAGEKITVRCRITTAGGRIDDRTVYLKIKER